MGQQQLLLVILVTIIVGIATVVAINTFSSAADSANLDAVRQDIASIAASAQGFYMKPQALGGGGSDFTDITFNKMAFGGTITGDKKAYNQNGSYNISSTSSDKFEITAYPASDDDYGTDYNTSASSNFTVDIYSDSLDYTSQYDPSS